MTSQSGIAEDRLLVGGVLRSAHQGRTFSNIDPTTEEILGVAADAATSDAIDAIEAARQAFDAEHWSTDLPLRIRCLQQLRDAIIEHKEELRQVLVHEAGCPLYFTRSVQLDLAWLEIDRAVEHAERYDWERPVDASGMASVLRREPRGVVSAITPFNYPLYLNLRKSAPALAAGCTVILKPSPETPWSASVLGRLVAEQTDIPAGVFNVLTSTDLTVGEMLTSDDRVDMVSFVGSSAVGRRIMAQAASSLKKLVLELGGKSAMVILDDADISVAAAVAAGVGLHAGQGCARLTRFLVARSRYDEAVEVARQAFGKIAVGDPSDEVTIQGPQISKRQQERIFGLIDGAERDGARCVFGGSGAPDGLSTGFFVKPTLLVDVDPDSTIAQEEIFGPVAVMIPFDGDDEAVRIANNSAYGLSGAVHSGDLDRALRVARRMRTGSVLINGGSGGPNAPFSGWKQSGIGWDNGVMGFEEHLEVKVLGLP
jgi:aldehyde dehydrogenase (NAD+)